MSPSSRHTIPPARLRVAIVGLGPKGLFALERLLDHARRAEACIDIDVFEPDPVPGAGPVYDPGQPGYLRMNFSADRLDMWRPGSQAIPASQQLSFLEWRRRRRDAAPDNETYPPRAHAGRYLADGLARLLRWVPAGVRIVLRRSAVIEIQARHYGWTLLATDNTSHHYDEVLVAVGHRTFVDGWPEQGWVHAAPLIPGVFPVTHWLPRDHPAPGATVAIRGFALTFLDAAIALTEGRGGSFSSDEHPYRLRYSPSSQDPSRIFPFSRTGRPMLAKPDPQLAASIESLEVIAESARQAIGALAKHIELGRDLIGILAATASSSLLAANGHERRDERSRRLGAEMTRWLAAASDGPPPASGHAPAVEVESSLAVGSGLQPPDLSWALGHTWRSVYPAVAEHLAGSGLSAREWPAFRNLAAEMERLAFGPPPVNAAKLLALVDAGRVDLTHVAAARIATEHGRTSISSANGRCNIDAVVNAVLPPPGALSPDDSLLSSLIADGHARIAPGRRGVEVSADAGCIGRDGGPTQGLSAIGRPTEDSVIGNDTLSRDLHPHGDRWARRVVARSARQPSSLTGAEALRSAAA